MFNYFVREVFQTFPSSILILNYFIIRVELFGLSSGFFFEYSSFLELPYLVSRTFLIIDCPSYFESLRS